MCPFDQQNQYGTKWQGQSIQKDFDPFIEEKGIERNPNPNQFDSRLEGMTKDKIKRQTVSSKDFRQN